DRPRRWAVFKLTRAALSQVSLVRGFGSSCSQPLLAKRPSKRVGSGLKAISREFPVFVCVSRVSGWTFSAVGFRVSGTDVEPANQSALPAVFIFTAFGGKVVPATIPSCNAARQNVSKSPGTFWAFQ